MLRSSRVLSGESYKHPLAKARAQEVLDARASVGSVSSVCPKRSARIAAQRTVATYMADGSVVRVPRGLPVTVTVRGSLSRSNTYADHEYGERGINHIAKVHDLLDATREPDIGAEAQQRRIHTLFRYIEEHGHLFLWNHDSFRRIVVDKARELRHQLTYRSALHPAEYHRMRACLSRVAKTFQ